MSISEQIETMITSMTGNNIPSEVVTINKAYNNHTCDATSSNGSYKNVRCSGLAVTGSKGLLTFEEGKQDKPFIILFENAENTILALGLGKFSISNDGDLYVELPEGVPNPFSINSDGDLVVDLPEDVVNNYRINDDGDLIYERWDI